MVWGLQCNLLSRQLVQKAAMRAKTKQELYALKWYVRISLYITDVCFSTFSMVTLVPERKHLEAKSKPKSRGHCRSVSQPVSLSVCLSVCLGVDTRILVYVSKLRLKPSLQLVPRSKHSPSVIKTGQLMLHREIIAVCSEIHTKHIT